MAKKVRKNKKVEEKIQYTKSSGNIFEDLGYSNPEEAKAKSDLAISISLIIQERKLTQEQAAKIIGIDQPKVSKIVKGILSGFTLERLMKYLVALGFDIEIKLSQKISGAIPCIHVTRPMSKRINARF